VLGSAGNGLGDLERLRAQAHDDLLAGVVGQRRTVGDRLPLDTQGVAGELDPERSVLFLDRAVYEVHRRTADEPGHEQIVGVVVEVAWAVDLLEVALALAGDLAQ